MMAAKSTKDKRARQSGGMSSVEKRKLVLQGLARKRECEAKALAIVERLIEPEVDREWLRQSCYDINASYYDDTIDERSCCRLCAYPLCDKRLENVARQKFKISTATNKVYDLTERKKFCSGRCFDNSNFLRRQLLTSPLWLREPGVNKVVLVRFADEAGDAPGGSAHKNAHAVALSPPGKESAATGIDGDSPPAENVDLSPEAAGENLAESLDRSLDLGEEPDLVAGRAKKGETNASPARAPSNAGTARKCRRSAALVGRRSADDGDAAAPPPKTFDIVARCFRQWYTLDTARFLYGEEFVSRLAGEMAGAGQDDEPSQELVACRAVASDKVATTQRKVQAFLRGKTEITEDTVQISEVPDRDLPDPVFPLVDKVAQKALRRRIVVDNLDRVLNDVLAIFGMERKDISDYLRPLLATFAFSADNIYFRQQGWTLVALVIVKLLALRDDKIRDTLTAARNIKLLNLVLLGYDCSPGTLEEFIDGLTSSIDGVEK